MANQYSNPAPKIIVKCPCGKKIITTQKRIDDGRGKYCSRSCKKKYCPPPKRVRGDQKTFNYNPTQFKKGHIPWSALNKGNYKINPAKIRRGFHYSPETEYKKGNVPWSSGKKRPEITGEKHPLWVGNKASYSALHTWVYRTLGKPSQCERCGATEAKRFEWHNKSGKYKRDVNDWERLCSMCHKHHHQNWKKKKCKKNKKR